MAKGSGTNIGTDTFDISSDFSTPTSRAADELMSGSRSIGSDPSSFILDFSSTDGSNDITPGFYIKNNKLLSTLSASLLGAGSNILSQKTNRPRRENLIKASYYRNPYLMEALPKEKDYSDYGEAIMGASKYNLSNKQLLEMLKQILSGQEANDVLVDTENQTQELR